MANMLNGKLVTLIGGSGFFGAHIAQALLERGARVRIASRNPEKAFKLKPLANLGQIQFARCDAAKPDSIRAVLQGSDMAVYMVGAFKGDLRALQETGAGVAAEEATRIGAKAFVHITAIGADPDSEIGYARTKGRGEQLVQKAFPKATVLRPSILFATDDEFVNMLAGMIAALPSLPVFGPEAKLQMLHVDDAADAVAAALANPSRHGGKTFEIGGPETITMMELHQQIAKAQGRSRLFLPMPDAVSGAFSLLPGSPMGRDQWKLLKAGNVASGDYPGIEQLGITPRSLGLILDKWMVRYRKHGRFAAGLNNT